MIIIMLYIIRTNPHSFFLDKIRKSIYLCAKTQTPHTTKLL